MSQKTGGPDGPSTSRRIALKSLAGAVGVALGSPLVSGMTRAQSGEYRIENAHSDKALTAAGLYPRANLVQTDDQGSPTQIWILSWEGNEVTIRNFEDPELVVSVTPTTTGVTAQLHRFTGEFDQLWRVATTSDDVRLIHQQTGRVLSVAGASTEDGADVIVDPPTRTAEQRWFLNQYYSPAGVTDSPSD